MDFTVWVNAGCRMQYLENRAHQMGSGRDVAVLNLGTIIALSDDSDNDCLSDCSDAIDRIYDSIGHIPLVVCAVPPADNKRGQRCVNMINTLLNYKCSTKTNVQFFHSKLTTGSISTILVNTNLPWTYKMQLGIFT